jgi:hypothetical protein
MKKIRDNMLYLAEIIDSWRVIPRAMAAAYGYMIFKLFTWYTNMPTYEERQCDDKILQTLISSGVEIRNAIDMACTVIGTVGGPTSEQTAFVTVIIGLSTAIFGFYVNSGNRIKDGVTMEVSTKKMQRTE